MASGYLSRTFMALFLYNPDVVSLHNSPRGTLLPSVLLGLLMSGIRILLPGGTSRSFRFVSSRSHDGFYTPYTTLYYTQVVHL